MIFNVVFPLQTTIDGDSLKEAIKNFIKLKHDMNITQMIISDRNRNIQANIRYYKEDTRDKVGINMFPVNWNTPPPIIVNDTYVPRNIVDTSSFPIPLSPIPMSPVGPAFLPTVINIPNL